MSHFFSHDKLLQTRVAKAPKQMSKYNGIERHLKSHVCKYLQAL